MQLISEAYFLMKKHVGMSNEEIADTFEEWNKGDLDSYLIEAPPLTLLPEHSYLTYTNLTYHEP